ncbi:hypothetical protein BGZ73_003702 [Actinomortierella ambigua]|nr:hypothetical protein BGZ73_003702 [Actinomortierella ambigua]
MGGTSGLDFLIGFLVSLLSSIMNAAGLNLLKLDHVRNSARPMELQRNECARPLWHIGLGLYILSQLAGSTIALNFLKTQWVAPLGSIALIFNFIFAKILVGTRITKKDVYGTIVVMASVIWIVVFGAMNDGGDIEDKLTLADLKLLFSRFVFILYFSILNIITFGFLFLGMYAYWAISIDDDASGQIRKRMKKRLTNLLGTNRFARASGLTFDDLDDDDHHHHHSHHHPHRHHRHELETAEQKDQRLKKVVAMIMAGCGGMLASQTLLLAKSGVKLITSTFSGNNQFTDYLSYFILFVLVVTAVLQVYCLNTGLKLYDSVLVVPMFYGFYTAFGLINSIIYLDQLKLYEPWVLLLVLIGIAALIYGVKMLSAPKPDLSQDEAMSSLEGRGSVASGEGGAVGGTRYNDDDDDETTMEDGRRRVSSGGNSTTDLERNASRSSKFSMSKGRLGSGADNSSITTTILTSTTTTTASHAMEDREELTRAGSKANRSSKSRSSAMGGGGGGNNSGGNSGSASHGEKHEGGRGSKLAGILKFGKNKGSKGKQQPATLDVKSASTTKGQGGLVYLHDRGSSTDLRRTSMFSKTSMQSDPFKTPKDSQSLSGDIPGEHEIVDISPNSNLVPGVNRPSKAHKGVGPTILDQDNMFEEPTHILIDTASEDEGDGDIRGQAALTTAAAILEAQQQQKRRPQESEQQHKQQSRPLSLIESAINNPFQSKHEPRGEAAPPPPLSTLASASMVTSPALMSPSQLKAHLTGAKSPLKPSPMQPQPDSVPTSFSAATTASMNNSTTGSGRAASVRWSTGNHLAMDKAFEDLNPFKVLRNNSHSHQHAASESRRNSLMSDGAFFSGPSSPRQHYPTTFSPGAPSSSTFASSTATTSPQPPQSSSGLNGSAPPPPPSTSTPTTAPSSTSPQRSASMTKGSSSHRRQDSFTGLPSSFDVPGRKKRHSMLFGVPGEGPHSPSGEHSPSAAPGGTSSPPSNGSSTSVSTSSSGSSPSSPSQHRRALSFGSRGASSPSLTQSTDGVATSTAPTSTTGRAGDRTSASHMYRDHYFTGVPGSPVTETAH